MSMFSRLTLGGLIAMSLSWSAPAHALGATSQADDSKEIEGKIQASSKKIKGLKAQISQLSSRIASASRAVDEEVKAIESLSGKVQGSGAARVKKALNALKTQQQNLRTSSEELKQATD